MRVPVRFDSLPPRLGLWLGLAVLLAASSSALRAQDLPPMYHVTVTPNYNQSVLVAPGPLGGTTYTVTLLNDNYAPMVGVAVQFVFNPAIRVCADAVHLAYTDQNGSCQVQLRAAGCINTPTPGACSVIFNGIELFMFTKVKSPDNASHTASQPSGSVTVADLIYFAQEFQGQAAAACHDYTNDGAVNTADLPTFGDAFKTGLLCPLR
jgi:hypothetical protein